MAVIGIINMLTTATHAATAGKIAEETATVASTIATGVDIGVKEGALVAALPAIAANKALTASYVELAAAEYMAAHASIPFAGFGIGAGFSVAAAAMVQAIGIMPFADGGIVGGSSSFGDRQLARVNAGEMILNKTQQANLFKMINSPQNYDRIRNVSAYPGMAGKVEFEIDGRVLRGVLRKVERLESRS